MPKNFNDNDQTKHYSASPSDNQPTFRNGQYPQQYQNVPPAGYPYPPNQNYQQSGYPGQNIYPPPQYQQPMYAPPPEQYYGRDGGKSKGNSGIIILLVITLLLILAVVGAGMYMYMSNNGSGGSKKNSSDNVNAPAAVDTPTENTTEAPTDEIRQVTVPDLRGSDHRNAEADLIQAGLRCETEYEFSDTVSENIVISQSIPAGSEVDEGTVVKILVSQGKTQSKTVIVPNVTGHSYEAAQKELEKYELNATASYTYDDKVAKDFVISQDISPGTEIYSGATIILTVSRGKDSQPVTDITTEPTPETTPEPTTSASGGSKKYGVVNTKETDLNVRNSPSTDGDQIGSLAKGSKVEIIGSEGNWYKIAYNGGYGYVSKDYIKITKNN